MSMKSKIFDSFLLFVSFNFFTLKLGIWKQKLAFSVQHPRMIPKRWCLLCFGIDHPVVQGSSAPQDCACCPHKRYLAHLVDHPGWFRGKLGLVFYRVIFWTSDANPGRIHHEGELFLVTSPWCISVIQVLPASGHTGWRIMSKCEPFGQSQLTL